MKVLVIIFVIFALMVAGIYYFVSSLRSVDAEAIAKDFVASLPTIFRTPGGNLEVAGITATETITSSDTATVPYFNWRIPGATTTVIIHVPVVYRYHVQVFDPWNIRIRDHTCVILAPALRPTLPPAIQTDKMEIRTFEGPLSFEGKEKQAKLLQSLTPLLVANATDTTRVKLVREEARKTVAEFVRTWLLQRGDWGDKKIENIKVVFRGELGKEVDLMLPADSLQPEVESVR